MHSDMRETSWEDLPGLASGSGVWVPLQFDAAVHSRSGTLGSIMMKKPDPGLNTTVKGPLAVRPRGSFRSSVFTLHRWVPFLVLALLAMTSTRPADGTGAEGAAMELPPCPASPNCVSSDAPEGSHHVAPFLIEGSPEAAWATAMKIIGEWPRTTAVVEEPTVARFECRSSLFRFVDDFELQLRADQDLIAVRSASRVGYSDFGVNRKRVEELRAALQAAGVVR